ncbi:unnamed protein product [Protopolystoma xenopodis]|uniref:Uncharacterized protein n=1 Tax=Protopolystoma xenopodis TaxID=117903 RepID=A0A448XQ62_9PLAT|nr:unnamed protein product [Protopolystoma xenopodis]
MPKRRSQTDRLTVESELAGLGGSGGLAALRRVRVRGGPAAVGSRQTGAGVARRPDEVAGPGRLYGQRDLRGHSASSLREPDQTGEKEEKEAWQVMQPRRKKWPPDYRGLSGQTKMKITLVTRTADRLENKVGRSIG